jgi:hypothetical protein
MDGFGVAASVLIAAGVVTKIVERLRKEFPIIDGTWVNLIAWGLGIAISFGFGLHVFQALLDGTGTMADVLDHLLTGFGIGSGASFFADWVASKKMEWIPLEEIDCE